MSDPTAYITPDVIADLTSTRLAQDPRPALAPPLRPLRLEHPRAGGRLVPTISRARYWLWRGEVEHARHPNERDRASYDPRNWEPLFEAGVAELFDGEPCAPRGTTDMCIVLVQNDLG